MVRFFVPLWSQSSLQKVFPTENFSKSKKQLSTFHLMIFACQVDIEPDWVRIFPQSDEFFSSLFRSLNIIFLLFGNIYWSSQKISRCRQQEPQKFLVSKLMFQCVSVVVPFLFSVTFSQFRENWEFSPRKNR